MFIPREEIEKCGLLEPKPILVNTPLETKNIYEIKIKELQVENERLKKKIADYEDERKCLSETITCDANVIHNLNKENAKLKCLAILYKKEMNRFKGSFYGLAFKFKRQALYIKKFERDCKAYRKAKAKLKEGEQ